MPAMRDGKTPDRPGRVRSRKHTRYEVERIVHFTAALLAGGFRKGDIKDALRGEYGINYRQAEVYLSRARKLLHDQLGVLRSKLRREVCLDVAHFSSDGCTDAHERVRRVVRGRHRKIACTNQRHVAEDRLERYPPGLTEDGRNAPVGA